MGILFRKLKSRFDICFGGFGKNKVVSAMPTALSLYPK